MHPAYIAGYFDGEGNIGVNWQRGRLGSPASPPTIRIQIVQKDRAALEAMQRVLGFGRIYVRKKVTGDVHCLTISPPQDVLSFIDLVIPYVHQKRDELVIGAELARLILAPKTPETRAQRFVVAERLSNLRRR